MLLTPVTQGDHDETWSPLYRAGGAAAVAMLVMIPLQVVIFVLFPPPTTAIAFLELFGRSALLGLLSFDLLYMVDVLLNLLLLGSLCAALFRQSPVLAALALAAALLGSAVYFASNPAFSMMAVRIEYAAATTELQRMALLGAAEAMVAAYRGVTNGSSYVLMGLAGLLVAVAMVRTQVFSRATAYLGLFMSVLMVVPSGAGKIGMVFALTSLLPLLPWLVLVARRLRELGASEFAH